MSEYTVKYNEATRSGKITLSTSTAISYLNGYAEFVKIITLTYSYKHDTFLLESIRGICEENTQKNWRIC